jgi:hypothetical protein
LADNEMFFTECLIKLEWIYNFIVDPGLAASEHVEAAYRINYLKHYRKGQRIMRTLSRIITVAAMALGLGVIASPAYAQPSWSALPGGCASTDNNFANGATNGDFPTARFRVPGGALTHNGFHDGYIAVVCNVNNPMDKKAPKWNQLQVTYRDPDGLQGLSGKGTEYQAYVELVRVSKTTGAWSRIAVFDSNLQCMGDSASCQGSNDVKNITVPFNHTFDFENYAYAVYGRLYRGISIFNLRPALYQLRLQTAPPVLTRGQGSIQDADSSVDQ